MKEKLDLEMRNKTHRFIRLFYILLFAAVIINIIYYVTFIGFNQSINSYNPRLKQIESSIIRGEIRDRNGVVLAESIKKEDNIIRLYPYERAFSHVIGYSHQGKTGIEALMDIDLLKSNLSVYDRFVSSIKGEEKQGDCAVTTLDTTLQLLANELLGENRGAIVAMEPSTGKILAMVSKPDFDPNYIENDWDFLLADTEKSPLLNRSTQGLYPPGSTFKILTTLAYLHKHLETDFVYFCKGKEFFGNKELHCYNDKAHGRQNLEEAFSNSCNGAFAKMGQEISTDDLSVLCDRLLFNQPLPYPLPYSMSSFILSEEPSDAEISETVIGQGKTLVTPLHMALITSAIANGGLLMSPYLVDHTEDIRGEIVEKFFPIAYEEIIDVEGTRKLTRYMIDVVESGTGHGAYSKEYTVAAKTGSAENPFGRTHSWFTGFAPADNPQIVITVIFENAGSSSEFAVPAANKLFQSYLTLQSAAP